MPERPVIGILVPPDWWSRYHLVAEQQDNLLPQLTSRFPGYTFRTNLVGSSELRAARAFQVVDAAGVGHEQVSQQLLEEIESVATGFFAPYLVEPVRPPNRSPPPAMPAMLLEFMDEIIGLYGMLVETDFAMLMFNTHFRQVVQQNPGSDQVFSRGAPPIMGVWGVPFQYQAKAEDIVDNSGVQGRNRVLRNRSIIVFLFALWEDHYRPAIAAALDIDKKEVMSDVFGDLRLYRNRIAHAHAKLGSPTKVLPFVQVGETIDLVGFLDGVPEIDGLFRMVVAELNRLSERYFNIPGALSLDQIAEMLPVAVGPSWRG